MISAFYRQQAAALAGITKRTIELGFAYGNVAAMHEANSIPVFHSIYKQPSNDRSLGRNCTSSSWPDISSSSRKRIAVGISGGVDSAVAAMLLKQAGHDVIGIFMRNWDEAEELGNQNCSIRQDLEDASAVCRQLKIPLHEVEFVEQYWTKVFSGFLEGIGRGLTPNPDLACNRYIKFGALLDFAASIGVETVATGHYARLERGQGGVVRLKTGLDESKDQSYFLAAVHAESLRHAMFPLGTRLKSEVRRMAAEAGLVPATKRSSAGICFIGRRNFAEFVSQYLEPLSGSYIDVETGTNLGVCGNLLAITYGQRAGIGGSTNRSYVVGKDIVNRIVYVAQGRHHPALMTCSAALHPPHWLSQKHADALSHRGMLECQYKARYGQKVKQCTLRLVRNSENANQLFRPSRYGKLHPSDTGLQPGSVIVQFAEPATAITPDQQFVIYDGDLCLGSAPIAQPGITLHELGDLRAGRWKQNVHCLRRV